MLSKVIFRPHKRIRKRRRKESISAENSIFMACIDSIKMQHKHYSNLNPSGYTKRFNSGIYSTLRSDIKGPIFFSGWVRARSQLGMNLFIGFLHVYTSFLVGNELVPKVTKNTVSEVNPTKLI